MSRAIDDALLDQVVAGRHRVRMLADAGVFRVEVHEFHSGEWRLDRGPYEFQSLDLAREMKEHLYQDLVRRGGKLRIRI